MKKSNLFILFLCCLCLACGTNSSDNPVWEGVDTSELKGEMMAVESLPLPYRVAVAEAEGLLITVNRMGTSNEYVSLFDINTGEELKSFLNQGSGPGEYLHVGHVQMLGDKQFAVYATLEKEVAIYHIDSVLAQAKPLPDQTITLATKTPRMPLILDQDLLVDERFNFQKDSLYRLNFYNGNGQLINAAGSFPEQDKYNEPLHMTEAYKSFLDAENGKVVMAHAYTDRLEVYDYDGNLINAVTGPDSFEPLLSQREVGGGVMMAPTKDTRRGYSFVDVGPSGIMAFYSGKLNSKERNNKDQLILFTADAKPIKRFKLDVPVLHFSVDWSSNTIYGVTDEYERGENELAVIKYKF